MVTVRLLGALRARGYLFNLGLSALILGLRAAFVVTFFMQQSEESQVSYYRSNYSK